MVAVVLSRDPSLAPSCVEELEAAGHGVHVVASAADAARVDPPDVVVVLAGPDPDLAFVEQVRQVLARAVPAMAEGGAGRVVVVVSATGLPGTTWSDESATASWGLAGLARTTARQVAPRGVTVNVVRTGIIDRGDGASTDPATVAALSELVVSTPIKRAGTPQEVAAAVGYLTSSEASYVTGLVLPVDGGLTIGQGA